MGNTNLRSERLELRPVRAEDVDRILEYRNRPEVTRWLLRTVVDPASFRAAWRRAAEDPDDHSVAVTLEGVVIGTVSLEVVAGMGQPGMPPRTQAELGYIFDPAYGGRGFAAEAVAAVVAHAFERLGVRRITAGCFADNLASVRLLEKLGMRREQHGVGDSWHAELGWVDGCTYALLAEDWHAMRAEGSAMVPSGVPAGELSYGSGRLAPMQSDAERATQPEDLSRLLVQRLNNGDVDGLTALYEPNAVLALPGGGIATGLQEIRRAYERLVADRPRFEPGTQQPTLLCGDLALTSSRLTNGAVTVEVARRQADGTWLWAIDQPTVIS